MKQCIILIPLLLAGSVGLRAAPAEEVKHDYRTWTSKDGRTLQAELVGVTEQKIRVRRQGDLRVFEIAQDNLSDESREQVQSVVRERKRDVGLKQSTYAAQIKGEFTQGTSKDGLNFQLFGNPEWDGTQRYPLVVWLHGAPQSGSDNVNQMGGYPKQWFTPDAQLKAPCFGLAPQCPSRSVGWKAAPAENLIALIKDLCEELPIDETRICLTGSSMGGTGTWYMLARWPEVFACGVPLSGTPDVKTVDVLKKIPVWVFHGEKDEAVPVESSRAMVEALKEVGGKVMFTELAGEGHLITTSAYSKMTLRDWALMQRKERPRH